MNDWKEARETQLKIIPQLERLTGTLPVSIDDYKKSVSTALKALDIMGKVEAKVDFEGFLMDMHAEDYIGTDDMMPDAFADWVQDLSVDDFTEYGNKYISKLLAQKEKRIGELDLLFQSLTPYGSEFVNDPQHCVAYAKELIQEGSDAKKDRVILKRKIQELEKEIEGLKR